MSTLTTLVERILPLGTGLLLERPARAKSLAQFTADLTTGGEQIVKRMAAVPENARNHSIITHIIGIEKWCQRRMRVALGEAPVDEEYNGYRPPKSTPWAELIPLFEATRRETLALVQQLQAADLKQRVYHNGYGDLSIGGWLRYTHLHSLLESRKLRL